MARPRRDAVLITRPAPDAASTADLVAALGYAPVLAPALEIQRLERLTLDGLKGAQGAVFTSAAAARAVCEDLLVPPTGLIAYCVGEKTAAAAREAGFARTVLGGGDADALLTVLLRLDPGAGSLVILRGRDVARPLAPPLEAAGFEVADLALYEAAPTNTLPAPALQALEGDRVVAVLFLSARTVEAFLRLVSGTGLAARLAEITAICNSERTAAPVRAAGWFKSVEQADRPTLQATLALLPRPTDPVNP